MYFCKKCNSFCNLLIYFFAISETFRYLTNPSTIFCNSFNLKVLQGCS